jgi:phosphate transport system protein
MTKTREIFDRQLTQLRDDIVLLGSMVETAIGDAMQALKEQDIERSKQIIAGDKWVNDKRFEIEELCVTLIATQQPTARDLRSIIAAMHIVTDLERMGDHASGIAELAIRLADQPHLKPLIDLPRMAKIDRAAIQNSLQAYLNRDTQLALETAKRDQEIDELYVQIYRELLTYMLEDTNNIARATHLLWVAHNFERIGDRVSNICERVIYLVTGKVEELNF